MRYEIQFSFGSRNPIAQWSHIDVPAGTSAEQAASLFAHRLGGSPVILSIVLVN